MRIGEAAARAGVSADTLRYYERLGLLPAAIRADNGYRLYPETTIRRILVIRNAMRFGFTLKELAAFLQARDTNSPPCRQVRSAAQQLLDDVDRQIADLVATRTHMRRTLREWDQRLGAVKPGAPARLLDALPTAPPAARPSSSNRMRALSRKRR